MQEKARDAGLTVQAGAAEDLRLRHSLCPEMALLCDDAELDVGVTIAGVAAAALDDLRDMVDA
ncbi:hypothetical protein [uncultured Roseibium sp.]|uniref:hypothetical protein n=1 Tax=uncultured Roseibium sp. TaxID=1936171 RepID=UPI0032176CFE